MSDHGTPTEGIWRLLSDSFVLRSGMSPFEASFQWQTLLLTVASFTSAKKKLSEKLAEVRLCRKENVFFTAGKIIVRGRTHKRTKAPGFQGLCSCLDLTWRC